MHNIAVRSSTRWGSGIFMIFFRGAASSDVVEAWDAPGDTAFRSVRSLQRGVLPPCDGSRVPTGLLRQGRPQGLAQTGL